VGLVIAKIREIREIGWKKILGGTMVGVGVILLFLAVISSEYRMGDYIGGWDEGSISKRAYLNMAALRMIKGNLWLGVGAGNFLVRLPEYQKMNQFFWLQPVHNIFLLMMTEIGILGLLMVGTKLLKLFKGLKLKEGFGVAGIILMTGMVDHYWISLPQNWWLMGIMLGMGIK
jgi:O-antigen ligase